MLSNGCKLSTQLIIYHAEALASAQVCRCERMLRCCINGKATVYRITYICVIITARALLPFFKPLLSHLEVYW